MPIIVLFYNECGLDLADIFILKSVYSIAMVSLEIPTGYLADVWGRRNCLIAGCIFCFFGFTNYSLSDTFLAFFMSEILLGFGQSLVSGADSALLYDTMIHYRKEESYLKYEGRVTMVGNFSEAFAGIFSGLLAAYSLRLPFYVQSGIAFIGIPAAFTLTEYAAKTKIENSFANIVKIIKYSLFTNKELCYNIMFSGVIGAATLTMAWFVQPLLIELDTPTTWFGIIWTILNLTVGISALYSDLLDQKLGSNKMYAFILFFIVGGYVAVSFNISYIGVVVLFFFYIVRGFATPILKGYINQITFSEMRATVLSIRNFIIRLMFAAMAPLVGWLHDLYSLSVALQATAAIIFIPGLLFLILQWSKREK
ncbi:MFS transporter [Butyricimonas synergistica]|uniref:MFS transporter n=1 Tax=Butyricimonas synergistica TaxID=544644 RepID=UPI000686B540|nr:MFS transporter [Butyricimonas synergistica]